MKWKAYCKFYKTVLSGIVEFPGNGTKLLPGNLAFPGNRTMVLPGIAAGYPGIGTTMDGIPKFSGNGITILPRILGYVGNGAIVRRPESGIPMIYRKKSWVTDCGSARDPENPGK